MYRELVSEYTVNLQAEYELYGIHRDFTAFTG
jgi:hypothetical protein